MTKVKQAQLLKVQVNNEVFELAVGDIKTNSYFAEPCDMFLLNQKDEVVAKIICKQYGTTKIFSALRKDIKSAIKNKAILILNDFEIKIQNQFNYVLFENKTLNIAEFSYYCDSYNVNNMNDVKKAMIKKYFGDIEKQLKKLNKNIKFDFDFEKFGDVKILNVIKYRQGDVATTLATISCGVIKQLSYKIDDFVF